MLTSGGKQHKDAAESRGQSVWWSAQWAWNVTHKSCEYNLCYAFTNMDLNKENSQPMLHDWYTEKIHNTILYFCLQGYTLTPCYIYDARNRMGEMYGRLSLFLHPVGMQDGLTPNSNKYCSQSDCCCYHIGAICKACLRVNKYHRCHYSIKTPTLSAAKWFA